MHSAATLSALALVVALCAHGAARAAAVGSHTVYETDEMYGTYVKVSCYGEPLDTPSEQIRWPSDKRRVHLYSCAPPAPARGGALAGALAARGVRPAALERLELGEVPAGAAFGASHFAGLDGLLELYVWRSNVSGDGPRAQHLADDFSLSLPNVTRLWLNNEALPPLPERAPFEEVQLAYGRSVGAWGGCEALARLTLYQWEVPAGAGGPRGGWLAHCARLDWLRARSMTRASLRAALRGLRVRVLDVSGNALTWEELAAATRDSAVSEYLHATENNLTHVELERLPLVDKMDLRSNPLRELRVSESHYRALADTFTARGRAVRVLTDPLPEQDCECRHAWLARALREGLLELPGGARCRGGGGALRDAPPRDLECEPEACAPCRCRRQWGSGALQAHCAAQRLREAPALSGITELHLQYNDIDTIRLVDLPDTLTLLDLRGNSVSRVGAAAAAALFAAPARRVRLAGNPLACDCANRALLAALRAHRAQVEDYGNVTCADGRALRDLEPLRCGDAGDGASAPAAAADPDEACLPTATRLLAGSACAGQTIFEDDFDTLNEDIWQIAHYIPDTPEYPFVSYQRVSGAGAGAGAGAGEPTVSVRNGTLRIAPVLLQSLPGYDVDSLYYGSLNLFKGCTGSGAECASLASGPATLPPAVSGRLASRGLAFTYGTVHVRAKLPQGDWLYPEILLEPFLKRYGSMHYASGVIKIATARGNRELYLQSNDEKRDFGNKVLYGGPVMDFECRNHLITTDKTTDDGRMWGDDFHVYSVKWTPDSITLLVDGEEWATIKPESSGMKDLFDSETCKELPREFLATRSKMAPFDDHFYLTLGVAAGGISEYRDDLLSHNGRAKPWRNPAVRARLNFWRDLHSWWPTWRDAELLVDYVKVIAL